MRALILAAGQGIRQKENGEPKPLVSLLGLKFIERVILTAKKSGIEEFQIVIGYKGKKIREYLGDGYKYGVKLNYLFNDEWKRGNGISVLKARDFIKEPFILLMADHLFDDRILSELQEITLEEDECVLCVDRNHHKYLDIEDATKVIIEDGRIKDIDKRLNHYNGIDTGIFLCTPALFDALQESIHNGDEDLSGGIKVLANRGKMKAFDISDKYWLDLDDDKALNNARSLLIEKLRKKTDGPISKIFNRPISIRISRLLVKTGVTPNQISLMSFIIAIFAALSFYLGDYIYLVIGGILVHLSSIIDGCDGEVARLKLEETRYGGWFDSVLDRYADGIIIFGLMHGHWTLNNDIMIWTVGFIAMIGSFLNSYTADKYDTIYKKKIIDVNGIRIGRDLRLFLIFVGALSGQILPTLVVLAIITNFESIRRLAVLKDEYA